MKEKQMNQLVVAPVDGSLVALNSLDYINLMWGTQTNFDITLLYIQPAPPPLFDDDLELKRKTAKKLKDIELVNMQLGEKALSRAKDNLLTKGLSQDKVNTLQLKKEISIAQDIYNYSCHKAKADAVIISTRGRSKMEAFFMGEVANNLLERSRNLPVWLINGNITKKDVLIGVDSSENCLRALDHAVNMLAQTKCNITLFHSKRDLRRFIPKEAIDAAPELEELWKDMAYQVVAPFMEKAKEQLINAGFTENDITTKIVDGSRSAAADILDEVQENSYGTIIMGRRGASNVKDMVL